MKIKHLLLPVFLAFAATSATADKNLLSQAGYPNLRLGVLEGVFEQKLKYSAIDGAIIPKPAGAGEKKQYSAIDGAIIIINSVNGEAFPEGRYVNFSFDLEIFSGSGSRIFRDCKILGLSIHSGREAEVNHRVFFFKGCYKNGEQIIEGFTITQDDLDSIR